MSLSIGIYEIFSNTIPGLLYLYVINETLRLMKLPYIDIAQLSNWIHAILLAVLAYILGILFDYIVYDLIYKGLVKTRRREQVFKIFNQAHPEIKHQLNPDDYGFYVNMIRLKNPDVVDKISHDNAIGVMLRNIAFGLFLFGLLYAGSFLVNGFSFQYLLVSLVSFVFAIIAYKKSQFFTLWYFTDIYEFILNYGSSLPEMRHFLNPISYGPPPILPKPEQSQEES